jgi:hypothetical protein
VLVQAADEKRVPFGDGELTVAVDRNSFDQTVERVDEGGRGRRSSLTQLLTSKKE